MTLDLPSSKIKEDQQWVKNIVSLVNKGSQKQAKKQKQDREKREKQKEKERKDMDSDKEFLHDGVVSVSGDTRTLADRLHEKLESMKGERGTGKKRKSVDEDDDVKKYITIEKMNLKKKKKTDTTNNTDKEDKTKINGKGDNKDKKFNKGDKIDTDRNNKNKNNDRSNGKNKKQAPVYDEDGVEYPGDFYGSEDDIDESLLSDNEMPVKPKKQGKQNKNKFQDTSPEDEESLQFSTFDFSSGKPVPMYLSNKSPKKKNLPKLLKKAEKIQKEMQDRSEKGKEKAEKYRWDRMLKKAQGEKVRDNPILIAKKMANIKKKKKQSAIKWKARNDQVERDKEQRLAKKNANIKAKMDRKKMASLRRTIGASKMKTPKKSGGKGKSPSKRPGFEGKKGSFINK